MKACRPICKWLPLVTAMAIASVMVGCAKKKDPAAAIDNTEIGQQVGDVMASIDEFSGKLTGIFSLQAGTQRTFARLSPGRPGFGVLGRMGLDWFLPAALAGSCAVEGTFTACQAGGTERVFDGCTIGAATFFGSVTLNFSDANCSLLGSGATANRYPDYYAEGLRGARLTVSRPGILGQRLTHVGAADFTFRSDGIRRVFEADGVTYFDFTTETSSDITVTGTNRSGRVVNGGTLRVTDNKSGLACSLSPGNVIWGATCNCASSGTWSGSCTDGSSVSVTLTGCGTATFSMAGASTSMTFDRCGT